MITEQQKLKKYAYMKQWRKRNKDKWIAQAKDWIKKNPEKVKIMKHKNYLKNKEHILKKCKMWAKNNPKERYKIWRRYQDKKKYDSKREQVLKRDNYQCKKCGITEEQHRKKYGYSLNVHHKDGHGYNKLLKNNLMNNLITLCKSCHAKSDKGTLKALDVGRARRWKKHGKNL